MMAKSKKLEKHLFTDDNEPFKVVYELICRDNVCSNSYGIAISTYKRDGNLNEFVELPDISENFIEIHALFMVLYKYEVTPITLYDVLDVLLDDFDLLNQY